MTVGVLLLAAGSSLRFGSDKRVATLASQRTILDASIDNILATQLPLLVCLRADDNAIAKTLNVRNIPYLLCQNSHNGMGATLSDGITCIRGWQGVLIALADMPFVSPSTYTQLACALRHDNICVPVNKYGRGHPVGFGAQWYEDLRGLRGDRGGYSILKQNEQAVVEVQCSDPTIQHDIDVPESIP